MKKYGFTLIEVVLVIAILSIALLGIIRIFPLGLRTKKVAEEYSMATLLGQKMLEEIKERGYDSLSTTYPSNDGDYGKAQGEFKESRGYLWEVEWWNTKVPCLRKVQVKVFYKEKEEDNTGEEASRKYLEWFTYIAKRS